MTDNELPAAKGGAAVQRRRGLKDSWPTTSPKGGPVEDPGGKNYPHPVPDHGAAGGQARFDLARNGRGLGDPPRGRRRDLPAKGKSAITKDHPSLGGPK